jgi:hypothetical protein
MNVFPNFLATTGLLQDTVEIAWGESACVLKPERCHGTQLQQEHAVLQATQYASALLRKTASPEPVAQRIVA